MPVPSTTIMVQYRSGSDRVLITPPLTEQPGRYRSRYRIRLLEEKFKMSITPDFLAILRCPFCKSKVELKPDGSGLKCESCHRVYPIRDDIPIMTIDEAVIENGEANA